MTAPRRQEAARDHYSYAHYADPATARSFDDRRFGGPIGELVAATQAQVLASMAGPVTDRTILDVGTGTGRAALLLARAGARVTGVDASNEMLAIARQRAAEQHADVRFLAGDAHALDFADRSFYAVVCFRVLMHTPQWRQCLAEVCRVADRRVIIDYPSAISVALLESMVRRVVHVLGGRTEPYRVFTRAAIEDELRANGFATTAIHHQFVLPIAFHKAIGSRRMTNASERLLKRAGLLNVFGSPVTIVAERA